MLKKWAPRIVMGRYGYKSSFGANKVTELDEDGHHARAVASSPGLLGAFERSS